MFWRDCHLDIHLGTLYTPVRRHLYVYSLRLSESDGC